MESCGHADAWFRVNVLEEARERIICYDCACEEIQELPNGWTVDVQRIGES